MKKLMFATALVACAAAFADGPLNAISFEGYNSGTFQPPYTLVNGVVEKEEDGNDKLGKYFYYDGDTDGSTVKAYGGADGVSAPNITRPLAFASAANANYLELSTEGGTLWRSINPIQETAGAYSLGNDYTVGSDGVYLDTLVQFTPTEDGGAPELDSNEDKLAIWLNVDSTGATPVTNLMVRAKAWTYENETLSSGAASFTVANVSVVAGQWYRLTIKAVQTTVNPETTMIFPAFQIFIDGTAVAATTAPYSSSLQTMLSDYWVSGMSDLAAANKLFPSLAETPSTLSDVKLKGIGFKGSGALDDIVWTTDDPFDTPAVGFTLTWPSTMTPVSYSIGDGAAVAISGTSPLAVQGVAAGDTVTFIVANADGAQKTLTGTVGTDAGIDATGTTFGWPEYLGATVSGAYTIDDFTDLDMLRKGVAAGLTTAGETFKQTANIDMTSAGAFAGIGTYNETSPISGVTFAGTYDGDGNKIANVTMASGNYHGIFNQVGGGTIKNLTVENLSLASGGCAIVGNFGGDGAVLQNLTATGSFCSSATPGTHNMAGIVVRACGGGSTGSLVKDCTNNASIYGNYTKLAGICAIIQHKIDGAGGITFDGCVNNGTLTLTRTSTGVTGLAGIVGYSSETNVMIGCSNTGSLVNTSANANTDCNGQLIGYAYDRTITDGGNNSAPANAKMIGKYGNSVVTGFKYATVDNGVATTVATLAKDTTYLLEGNVAASETPVFTLAAAGDWIEFNTALGYTFAGTVAGEGVTNETTGTVTKYWIPSAAPASYEVVIGNDTEHPVSVTLDDADLAVMDAMGVDTNNVVAVNYALNMVITNGVKAWEFAILGLPPSEAALDTFKIDSITIAADGKVTVAMDNGVAPKVGRGVDITLKVLGSNDLTTWDTTNPLTSVTNPIVSQGNPIAFPAISPALGETKKFYKVVVEFAASPVVQ